MTQYLPDGAKIKQETEFSMDTSWGNREISETTSDSKTINSNEEICARKQQEPVTYKEEHKKTVEELNIKIEIPIKEEILEISPCTENVISKHETNMTNLVKEDDEEIDVKKEFVSVKEEPAFKVINVVECQLDNINHLDTQDTQSNKTTKQNVPAKKGRTQKAKRITKSSDNGTTTTKINSSKTKEKKTYVRKKNHICTICGSAFTHDYYLARHMISHTGVKPYPCKNCDKKFIQRAHLVQHLRIHTGEKPYSCNICENKAFNHKYNYKTHMKKHFKEPSQQCNLCSSAFHQKGDLQRHMRTHTGEKPFSCNLCTASFGQNCHLKQHLRIHTKEKPFSCKFCEETFPKKKNLNDHLTIHTDEELFVCSLEDCSKVFQTRSEFLNHIKYHTQKKTYCCDKCNKTYKSKGSLTSHTVLVHDKNKIEDDL